VRARIGRQAIDRGCDTALIGRSQIGQLAHG
jgi:hypothetical protein